MICRSVLRSGPAGVVVVLSSVNNSDSSRHHELSKGILAWSPVQIWIPIHMTFFHSLSASDLLLSCYKFCLKLTFWRPLQRA